MRVRWAEVDMQKIVFNAHYLMYIDTAVADYWRALGLPYETALSQLEGDLFVKKASLEYHASARYEDLIDVGLRCARVGTSSITFVAAIYRADTLLVSGELIYVFADPKSQQSKPVPPALREIFEAFEAAQPMVHARIGSWTELEALITPLRTKVLVDELGMDRDLVFDAADTGAQHACLQNRLGQTIAVARRTTDSTGVAKIDRIAVQRAMRGVGLGKQVAQALAESMTTRQDTI
jgi:YbgC/YbaW family acyl-CoA thioester hydrolase